jgi:SIR2-like protein
MALSYSKVLLVTGAGACVAAGVPAFSEYWKLLCRNSGIDGTPLEESSDLRLTAEQRQYLQAKVDEARSQWMLPGPFNDVEAVFKRIRLDQGSAQDGFGNWPQVSDACGSKLELLRMRILTEYRLREHFLAQLDVDFARTVHHHTLAQYRHIFDLGVDACLDLFTLNNDLFIEWLCERYSVPVTDSFRPDGTFDPSGLVLGEARAGVRLYKLHGSIDWRAPAKGRSASKTAHPRSLKSRLLPGHIAGKAADTPLIWPGIYGEFDNELASLRLRFAEALSAVRVLIVVGYGLRDDVIRQVMMNSLHYSSVRRIFVISPGALADTPFLEALVNTFPGVAEHVRAYFPAALDAALIRHVREFAST